MKQRRPQAHLHAVLRRHRSCRVRLLPVALAAAGLVAACGSDGDDSAGGGDGGGGNALTISGHAATGAALANAPVEAKCNGGSQAGTTAADGSYALTLPDGAALPCVLKATAPSGAYYSVATGSGSSARANLTPLTTLAVAYLAGGDAAGYFDGFSAGTAAGLTDAQVQASVAAVKAVAASAGIDLSAIDPLAGALVPATSTSTGNAHDQALDALAAKLAATGTTLNALSASVAASGGTAAPSATPSLPAQLLLQPKAAHCAALRSGTYLSIDTEVYSGLDGFPVIEVRIDAAAQTATDVAINETSVLKPVAGWPCRYSVDDGIGAGPDAEIVVSGAGVIVTRYLTQNVGGTWYGSVLIPKQSHTLAELAGDWNFLGHDTDSGSAPFLQNASFRLGSTGAMTSVTSCRQDNAVCRSAATGDSSLVSDGGGAFYLQYADGSPRERVYFYRAGGGELMGVVVRANGGGLGYLTRKAARALPAVGDVSGGWQINVTLPSFTVPAVMSGYKSTVASLDSATQSYVRDNVTNFTTTPQVTIPETIEINKPRDGFLHRVGAANVTRSDGSVGNVGDWVNLPLRGMGVNAVGITGSNVMVLSVSSAQ